MDEEQNLRRLVMKKSAAGGISGSPLISPNQNLETSTLNNSSSGHYDSRYYVEPLIQQIGPDFSKLSRELNRVVLKIQHQAEISADCPMHSHETSEPRRGSRAPDPVALRRRSNEVDHYQDHRRSLSGSLTNQGSRAGSRETLVHRGSLHESNYQSLPRRLNKDISSASSKVDRRQSFQDYRTFRDKFVGKVEFKDTLRRVEDPKRPERDRARVRISRPYESRDYAVPTRSGGYLIESDFDFRSPPSTRDTSRDRKPRLEAEDVTPRRATDLIYASPRRGHEDVYASPRRGQEEIYASSRLTRPEDVYASPRRKELRIVVGGEKPVVNGTRSLASPSVRSPAYDLDQSSSSLHKDPLSPRRVEFADEVFSFKSSRPGSRCESPIPKSILRHTNSDPHAARSQTNAAVRSNTSDLSFLETPARPTTLVIPTDGSSSFSTQHFNNQISINHHNQEKGQERQEDTPKPTHSYSLADSKKQCVSEEEKRGNLFYSRNQDGALKENGAAFQNGAPNKKGAVPLVNVSPADQNDVDSDETLTEERSGRESRGGDKESRGGERESKGGEKERWGGEKAEERGNHETKRSRAAPPFLSEWSRSQSFPPPANGQLNKQSRKTSDPLGLSTFSLDSQTSDITSDMELIRAQNNSLRTRVGDLEQQVVDNNDEIKCLKATLAECLRRIDEVEVHTRYCQQRVHEDDQVVKRRPLSATGVYPSVDHSTAERRGSYGTRA